MSLSSKDKELLSGIKKLRKIIKDSPLPFTDIGDPIGAFKSESAGAPIVEDKLTESDIRDDPTKTIIESRTGQTHQSMDRPDGTRLHPNDFDKEELRKAAQERLQRASELKEHVDRLMDQAERKILSKGPVDVHIDPRTNLNGAAALRRLFGRKGKDNVITFEMYKQALKVRERFSREDVESSMGGIKLGEPLNANSSGGSK